MRRLLAAAVGILVFSIIVLPSLISGIGGRGGDQMKTKSGKLESATIHVYLHEENKIVAMPLEEYVEGVVSAEMPAEFQMAALEAQAVAARTYAIGHMRTFGGKGVDEHPEADVSTDHTKYQAWVGPEVLKQRWGAKTSYYQKKIKQAVEKTRGLVLLYDAKPIHAVFHSTSGTRTASAKEVWGFDYPYLQSVECKWDQASPRFREDKAVALSDLAGIFGADADVVAVATSGGAGIQIIALSDSGRVKEMKIGTKSFTGQEVRNLLGLKSEKFTTEVKDGRLIFHTEGYGHGVGLCQYGANGMAKEGRTFQDILQYYYSGVEIKNIYDS